MKTSSSSPSPPAAPAPSSVFARWDDPMGRYANSYTNQSENLLGKLKNLHEAIEEHQLEEKVRQRQLSEEREQSTERNKSSSNNLSKKRQQDESSSVSSFLKDFSITRIEIVITRLEQQLLVSKRLRKIIEHYSIVPPSSSSSNTDKQQVSSLLMTMKTTTSSPQLQSLIGGLDWCAVASQVKAALAGFLQQLRLDILCATTILIEFERKRHFYVEQQRRSENNCNDEGSEDKNSSSSFDRDPAEKLVEEIASSLFTIPNEIYRLCSEVAEPLLEKASTSVSSVMESMLTFASPSSASIGNTGSSGGVGGSVSRQGGGGAGKDSESGVSRTTTTHHNNNNTQQQSSRHGGGGGGATSTSYTTTNNKPHQQATLHSSSQEYVNCLTLTSDPVITALSVACRGNEHLHAVHVEMLRGLMSNVVLGLIRRHSLLTGAVRMIREISQKYHRIVEGQNALKVIKMSVALVMGEDDKIPEPSERLTEVDSLGRLLQEVNATAIVMKETTTVLRHWAFETNNKSSSSSGASGPSPSRHAFDNPSQVRTSVAQQHTKTNGLYLLQNLRNMSSLLRRVAAQSEKTLSTWSEPALNSFSKILEVHSAPLLQCARAMANSQTDMKQLIGLCKEKAVQVDEVRIIEDTLAVLGTSTNSLVYTSFDHQLKEIETLSRSIHSISQRSTGILNEVVTTLCKPIAQNTQLLPCQYVDNEIDTLSNSMKQLCNQHDNILVNLKSTTYTSTPSSNDPSNKNSSSSSSNALSLQEMTTSMNSARLMNEAEQRAVAASCSFDRLYKICQEIDDQCNMWFRNRGGVVKMINQQPNRNTETGKDLLDNSSTVAFSQSKYSILDDDGIVPSPSSGGYRGINDAETTLDEESLKTAAPSALLPTSTRNEDRVFAMNVLKGTIRHLQTGEQHFLVVPRPDKVNSPADLNDYEDEFSVAFVGVEGLCEQVFSSRAIGGASQSHPPISITSASSLDVLARVGAAAAAGNNNSNGAFGGLFSNIINNNNQNDHQSKSHFSGTTSQRQRSTDRLGGGGGGGGGMPHHQRTTSGSSSVGTGMNINPSIRVTSDHNNNYYQQHHQQQHSPSSMSPSSPNAALANARRVRSSTMVSNRPPEFGENTAATVGTLQAHHQRGGGGGGLSGALSSNSSFAAPSLTSYPSNVNTPKMTSATTPQHHYNHNNNSNVQYVADGAQRYEDSTDNRRLIRRSFTYQAAMAMPEHEMVPPTDY